MSQMARCDAISTEGRVYRGANPTPDNKKGGLSPIVEKTMGFNGG